MADLLVVEDDPDAAETIAEVLTLEGHQARVAVNGAEALAHIRQRRPDLVLLDVEMPVMSGPTLANRLLVLDCGLEEIPILLLSGVPNLATVARQVGTAYFLAKPYRYERLLELVERALIERAPPTPLNLPLP